MISRASRRFTETYILFLLSFFSLCHVGQPRPGTLTKEGVRRALLVGVSRYRYSEANLKGPSNDVADMQILLSRRHGFTDIRELLNEKATPGAFREAMTRLTADTRPQDTVLVYFSGHGGQTMDLDGDEGDGKDETLVFHEPGEGAHGHVLDDEFNQMLQRLYHKSSDLVVILDSCHSETGYRGGFSAPSSRFWPTKINAQQSSLPHGDGDPFDQGHASRSLPKAILLCAARDGSEARDLERNGAFTKALIQVLAAPDARNLTWVKVAYRLKTRLEVYSPGQLPSFNGELWRPVFGGSDSDPPLFWTVVATYPQTRTVDLNGPPMSGMGPGATLLIHDHNTSISAFGDPNRATARIVVRHYSGVSAQAEILKGKVEPGDLAILDGPVSILDPMRIRVRREPALGGISPDLTAYLEKRVADPRCRDIVIDPENWDFEFYSEDPFLVLGGRSQPVYSSFPHDWPERGEAIVRSLQQFAFRRELLALQSRGALGRKDLLEISLEPNGTHSRCSRGHLTATREGLIQNIPLCHAWNLRVGVSRKAPREGVRVGGLLLTADGGIIGFPNENSPIVKPGRDYLFEADTETFIAGPPVGVCDTLLIFATEPGHAVNWGRFTISPAANRERGTHTSLAEPMAALQELTGTTTRTRGLSPSWRMVSLTLRVQAHPNFPEGPGLTPAQRFLLEDFDIRPYLPGRNDPRRKLLDWADRLVTHCLDPKSRNWPRSPLTRQRAAELAGNPGRAIAFLLSLFDPDWQVKEATFLNQLLKEQLPDLKPIRQRDIRMGDVLVFGDPTSGLQHAVLVVDSGEQLAVGSFPWSEVPRLGFQKILTPRDWSLLGFPKTRLIGCYRHGRQPDGVPNHRGAVALKNLDGICDPGSYCQ